MASKQSAISAITHNQSERTISFGVTADEDDEKKGIGGGDHPHPLTSTAGSRPFLTPQVLMRLQ